MNKKFNTQKTIDSFFTSKNSTSIRDIKRYFYVRWDNKFRPTEQAYWTDKRPENINFIEQIHCNYIKTGYYFYICGYFPDNDENSYFLVKEKTYKNIEFLKSHLQKCIRKQNDILAIPTTLHLMKLDLNNFLRRIIIIMIEDVFLHESLTTLVWIMIAHATKKFKMKKYIYEWLLGIVYILCIINEKDNFYDDLYDKNIETKKVVDMLSEYEELKMEECSILYSIHLRIAYGGMESDIRMLKKCIYCWYDRFKTVSKDMYKNEVKPIKINVSELKITDWDLSAIDYHCSSKILEYILKKYEDLTENELKKLIWKNSSSINTRVNCIEYNIEKWNEIKNYVNRTQKYILESSY
jgi:hypothetical protein